MRTEDTGERTPDGPSSAVGVAGRASGSAWQDDGTGLQHTPAYTQCRCGGRTYTLTGVTRTLVHALDSLALEGITTPLEEDLVNRAKELYSSDLEMVKRLNGLRRKRLDKIFAEGGVWKTLVLGYRREGRYGLLLAQHFLGHSPRTVATRNYVAPPQTLFDEAVIWLREQYGF